MLTFDSYMQKALPYSVYLFVLLSLTSCLARPVGAAEKPNVVLIMTDDQGWGDVRSHGNEIMWLDEVTLGDVFTAAGYATGAFGKWHNSEYGPYHPNHRSFQEFIDCLGFDRGFLLAYYLNYQKKRGSYVDAFWNAVDWSKVAKRFSASECTH